jgi:diguanylate cyclase (GGDEF)-like protein/PAS domain S-box-containing protein
MMDSRRKTNKELLEEITNLRKQISFMDGSNTSHKTKANVLRNDQRKFRSIIKDLTEGYFETDLAGNITFFNDAMCKILDRSPEELMGLNNRDYTKPETARLVYKIFTDVYRTGKPARVTDYEFFLKSGQRKVVEMSAYLMRDLKGQPIGFFGLERDVTERSEKEEELRKSEERYRTILKTIEDGYYEVDLAGNMTFCNDAMCRIAGIPYEELIGMNNREYVSAETAEKMYRAFNEVYRTGKPVQAVDYEVILKTDGSKRTLSMSIALTKDPAGNPIGFSGITRDLTDSKRAERLYATVAEQSLAGIFIIRNGKFLYINARAAGYTGHTPEELVGKDPIIFVHPDDRAMVSRKAEEISKGQTTLFYEYRIVTNAGNIRWIVETVAPIVFEGELAILGSSMDITDRKEMEEKLRASEVRYRTIIENTGTAMLIVENNMIISLVNSGFEEMVGYMADKVEGKKRWPEFVSKKDIKRMIRYRTERKTKPDKTPENYEGKLIGRSGRILDVLFSVSVIPETDQSVISLIDISERKRMEQNLLYVSTHDALTDLYNRAFFENEVGRLEQNEAFPVSVMMMDVDDLKAVNDTKGHKAGDAVLRSAAYVLRTAFRKKDIVARIGGDEFAVILPRTDTVAAKKTIRRVRHSLFVYNKEHPRSRFNLSMGFGTAEKAGLLADILNRADQLMYQEKTLRKNFPIAFRKKPNVR